MDFSRLEKNIIDVIKEEQVKLGYRSELIRLYYPIQSLNRLLKANCNIEQMHKILKDFCEIAKDKLGEIEVTNQKERFCFAIPPQGVDFVHQQMGNKEFIYDFIRTIEKHGCTMDDLLKQFYKYSDNVHVEKADHGEFDYVVYFEDGAPDDFRYCITDEGCHMIYHRFTKEDYDDFHFDESF